MDYEKIIRGLLSGPYKQDEGKISEIFNQADETLALAEIMNLDRERVSKLKPAEDGKTKFQEGYQKAKKEERSAFEKELKDEYGIESDLQGKDLVEHIVTTKAAEASKRKPGTDITEDEVKASKTYRDAEKRFKKELEEKETAFATKLEETEKGFQSKQTRSSFQSNVLAMLDELKPVLPKDEAKARKLREAFLREFDDVDEIRAEDGDFVLLKGGKVLDDGHGNSVNWKDLTKNRANAFFEFPANNGGTNSGNSNDKGGNANNGGAAGGAKGYPDGIAKPTNLQEYSKIVSDRTIPLDKRQQVKEAWNAETGRTE